MSRPERPSEAENAGSSIPPSTPGEPVAGCLPYLAFPMTASGPHRVLVAARCAQATLFGKVDNLHFQPSRVHIVIQRFSGVACLAEQSGVEPLDPEITNPWRFATVVVPVCGMVALAGLGRRMAS